MAKKLELLLLILILKLLPGRFLTQQLKEVWSGQGIIISIIKSVLIV